MYPLHYGDSVSNGKLLVLTFQFYKIDSQINVQNDKLGVLMTFFMFYLTKCKMSAIIICV